MEIAEPIAEPGLHLVVDFQADRLTVLRAARIGNASMMDVRSPLLRAEAADWSRPAHGGDGPGPTASELCLALLDARGKVVETFAWPARAQAFLDRSNPRDPGGILGGPRETRETLRLMRVPVPDSAAYLCFYRSDLHADARGLTQHPLATYYLNEAPPPLPLPPLPIPGPAPAPEPLPWADPWKRRPLHKHRAKTELVPWWTTLIAAGYIEGVETLVNNGDSAHRFDIVIVGDGFQHQELPIFDAWAQEFCDGLLALPPFDSVARLINVHTVRTVSYSSGVSNYPAPNTWRLTYYGVEGHYENAAYPGYFGTHIPQRVWDAVEYVAPLQNINLVIVLVNTAGQGDGEGASTPPGLGMAFNAHWNTPQDFINFGAHECCHVIAGTSEEYIGCSAHNALAVYPNQATEQQIATGPVTWLSLAWPGELKMGNFRAVHQYGDAFDVNGKDPVFTFEPERNGMLGLYWGCQDSAPAVPPAQCDPYQDARGRFFYRPMAKCKMRRSRDVFCRVCANAIARRVMLASL